MSTSPHQLPVDLPAEFEALHDEYVDAVNRAVAEDDMNRVHRLAAEFDELISRAGSAA